MNDFFNHSFTFKTWKKTCLLIIDIKSNHIAVDLLDWMKYWIFIVRKNIHWFLFDNIGLVLLLVNLILQFIFKIKIYNIYRNFLYYAAAFYDYNLTKNRFITSISFSFFPKIPSITLYTAEILYPSKYAHKIIWGIICVPLSLKL